MKKIKIHQVDAFTNKLFGGNPAGVVFDADILSIEEIKNIAREMNLSETAFILKPTQENADFKLKYFTPAEADIKFCGHATIGSLYEIGRTGLFETETSGHYKFRVETDAGVLPMEIIKKSAIDISVTYTTPEVILELYHTQHGEFARRLGIPLEVIDMRYPIMIEKNINDIHLVIKSLKDLEGLVFNFQHIIDSFKEEAIVVFSLLTPETFDKENDIHVRGLAPLVGVPEDPFTGRLQGAIATYVKQNNIIPQSRQNIRTEQGNFIGRPGFATIEYPQTSDGEIMITGQAAHVFSTEMYIA